MLPILAQEFVLTNDNRSRSLLIYVNIYACNDHKTYTKNDFTKAQSTPTAIFSQRGSGQKCCASKPHLASIISRLAQESFPLLLISKENLNNLSFAIRKKKWSIEMSKRYAVIVFHVFSSCNFFWFMLIAIWRRCERTHGKN